MTAKRNIPLKTGSMSVPRVTKKMFPDSLRKTNALERNLERAKRYLELAARSAKAAAFAGVEAYAEELTQYADAELEKLRQGNPGRDADAPFRTAEG